MDIIEAHEVGWVSRKGGVERKCIENFGKKSMGRTFRILMSSRKDNIKISLMEIGEDGVDWIYLALDRGTCWANMNMLIKL